MKTNSKQALANTSVGDKIANTAIALFSVILTVLIIVTLLKINDQSHDFTYSPNDILRSIKNEYYFDAIEDMYSNIALNKTISINPDYTVPYSLVYYCESAFYFTAYGKAANLTTDPELSNIIKSKAGNYQKNMESARSNMEDLVFMADSIDVVFN